MKIHDLKKNLVAVLGYGTEGRAVTKYLIKHGVKPVLFDQRPWQEWNELEQIEIKSLGLNFIFGPDAFLELTGFDVAFRSPGIKLTQLKNFKGLITSQTNFFFDNCPCKIIGVTGTKGKGTTSTLIYEILSNQTKILNLKSEIFLTGNIGKIQSLEFLDSLKPDDLVVYELSSFQLQDLRKSPHIGVVLMTTSEHLDYHADQDEYIEAKTAIVKYQGSEDFAIVNADFPSSVFIGEQGTGKKIYFSRQKELTSGIYLKKDEIQVKDLLGADYSLPTTHYQLKGVHNLENIEAAIAASLASGVKNFNLIQSVIDNFKGLEHRLELVAKKNGISFYDDSFSTTPETTIAAINSFNEPIILILGGASKKSNFDELGKVISNSNKIKAVILIGVEAERLKQAINNPKLKYILGAKNMVEIFEQIKSVAISGDIVLLSPACVSFDMFKNYQDRGQQFKNFVYSY